MQQFRTLPAGFTLVEIMVTMGIYAIIISTLYLYGVPTYTNYLSFSDESIVLTALLKARADAMNETCSSTSCTSAVGHGIHLSTNSVEVIEGKSYEMRNTSSEILLPLSGKNIYRGAVDIWFDALSGSVSSPATIQVVRNNSEIGTISISGIGQISESK